MKKRHFTLIHKTHLLWSKLNLYKKAHFELQKTYKINNFKYSKNLELFIDSTDIYIIKRELKINSIKLFIINKFY